MNQLNLLEFLIKYILISFTHTCTDIFFLTCSEFARIIFFIFYISNMVLLLTASCDLPYFVYNELTANPKVYHYDQYLPSHFLSFCDVEQCGCQLARVQYPVCAGRGEGTPFSNKVFFYSLGDTELFIVYNTMKIIQCEKKLWSPDFNQGNHFFGYIKTSSINFILSFFFN